MDREKHLPAAVAPDALADPNISAVDLTAEAASYPPKPLVAADLPPDHIGGMAYTGGTTGKPKGVLGTAQSITTMTTIQLAEWEWPENPRFLMCTPLSHAGAAFFVPTISPNTAVPWFASPNGSTGVLPSSLTPS